MTAELYSNLNISFIFKAKIKNKISRNKSKEAKSFQVDFDRGKLFKNY
jgi:hypothetical protein